MSKTVLCIFLGVLQYLVLQLGLQSILSLFLFMLLPDFIHLILLHLTAQFSQHHILTKLSFLHCILLLPLLQIYFLASQCLVLCQYHIVLITIALLVQSEVRETHSSSFLLLYQDCSGSSGHFVFLYTLRKKKKNCSSSVINATSNLTGIALNMQVAY